MKTLGLIGGTTWLSTIEYYRLINEGVSARLGPAQTARCIIHSFNFADVNDLQKKKDWDALLELVGEASINLRNSGADGIVLCANTLHIIADRLETRVGLPLVNIIDATAAEIRRLGIDR